MVFCTIYLSFICIVACHFYSELKNIISIDYLGLAIADFDIFFLIFTNPIVKEMTLIQNLQLALRISVSLAYKNDKPTGLVGQINK